MIRSSQTLYINSKQRSKGFDHDFYITLPIQPANKFTHVSVLGISIPKSFYSVQNNQNTFIVREVFNNNLLITDNIITVPEGNYTINSFIITLKDLFVAAGLIEYNIIQENSKIQGIIR